VTGVAFALFDWIDRRQGPLGQLYEERLQLLEAAEDSRSAPCACSPSR